MRDLIRYVISYGYCTWSSDILVK